MTMQFSFDNYVFDLNAGLRCDGRAVHLPPKEKGLLHMLLCARGQVVRKDELIAKVWGTVDASDESISRTVYRLRVAMQTVNGPDVVETIYSSGFRIRVPVRVTRVDESSSLSAITHSARPGAVSALMGAREFLARRSARDIDAAAGAARLAITLDPGFAAAWATLAEVRVFQAIRALRQPREAAWLARQAADSALEIDPECAPALAVRGWTRALVEHDFGAGLLDLDRALGLDPDYWGANLLRGWALQAMGRHRESVAMMRRAFELNSAGHAVNAILAYYLMLAGELDEALASARELALRFPTIDDAQAIVCVISAVHGLHGEAIEHGHRALHLAPDTPAMHMPLAYALAAAGQHARAREMLETIEGFNLPQPSACLAPVYLALGERARALALLADACERGQPQFAWTRDDPRLAALHGDPQADSLWARLRPRQLLAA